MKAVLLAAGKGERLQGITREIPKPMISFRGKPLLLHNIELCRRYGIRDLYINTHHLPDTITSYFGDGKKFDVNIHYSLEQELLGTAGAVKNFEEFLKDEPFFVVYADNYSDWDLDSLKRTFVKHQCVGVIAFHWREDVSSSGVAEFDDHSRILRFFEKPKARETDSHWVNAGIYYFSPKILDYIPPAFSDFGRDIFPTLIRNHVPLYGVCENTPLKGFDTPEMYNNNLTENS